MSTATDNGTAAEPNGRKRRGRPAGSDDGQPAVRFFAGEISKEGITLAKEFTTEPEAQLNSLKQEQPYFSVQAWKATADLSAGTVAVTKRPFAKP